MIEGDRIGALVRAMRKEREMTQEAFVSAAGISVRGLRDLENGVKSPTIETLTLVANVFELELWQFLKTAASGPDDGSFEAFAALAAKASTFTERELARLSDEADLIAKYRT